MKGGAPSDRRHKLDQWDKWEIMPVEERPPIFQGERPVDMIRRLKALPPRGIRSDMGYELPWQPIIKDSQAKDNDLYYDNAYEWNSTDFVRTKKRNAAKEQEKWAKRFKMLGAGALNGIDEITESKEEYQHEHKLVAEARVKDREIEMLKTSVKRLEEHNKELIWAKEDLKDENRELKKRVQELVENEIDSCWP